ncbi:SPOR domain-containing protein [Mucilaginibacter antarcticus]
MPMIARAQTTRGTVEIIKDARIDSFAARRATLKVSGGSSSAPAVSSGGAGTSSYGYRVQIFNGPNRKSAFATQEQFINEHAGMRTYISYSAPNYKVHAGDFRTRLEADRMMQELKGAYTGLFIIRAKINPPKIAATDD